MKLYYRNNMAFFTRLTVVFCFISSALLAQVSNIGHPKSWNGKIPDLHTNLKMPFVDVQEQLAIDAQNKANGIKMLRFGYEHSTDINVCESGEGFFIPNGGKITRLGIVCPNALSVNLIFDQFHLSTHATVFFYDSEHKEYIGAYTAKNNNVANMLGTEIIHSDKVVVELFEPKDEIGKSSLNIGVVVHGYLDVDDLVSKALNSSGDCEYDVNCPIGNGWDLQRNGVAMMMNGGGFCTGTLVNNTSGSIIPYFLTANHCGTSPGSWVFRFRWESPAGQADCATAAPSVNGPETMNVNGAVLRANSANSDFCLVELNTPPDPSWNIFYNGWDNSGSVPTRGTGIHHPNGDIKKISIENDPLSSSTWSGTPANSHWKVNHWDNGVTEPGSSGSPIFDENHRVVGQLHGGNSACGGADLSDNYGKFSMSWLGEGTDATQLKHWLDPSNTGATSLNGVDPAGSPSALDAAVLGVNGASGNVCSIFISPEISIQNLGSTTLTQATIFYNFNGGAYQQYNWSGNLTTYQIDVIQLPLSSHPDGLNTMNVYVSAPNGGSDQNASNDTVTTSFSIYSNATSATLTIHPDCYSSETSWKIRKQSDHSVVASGGPYSDNSSPLDIVENRCLPLGCYYIVMYDSYGDGMNNTSFSCTQKQGSFELKDMHGNLLCQMTTSQAAFGDSLQLAFCVSDSSLNTPVYQLDKLVSLFPNPSTDFVNVEVSVEGAKEIQLWSLSGKLLLSRSTTNYKTQLDLSGFEKGVYFVQISTPQGEIRQKLVKQ